jgi:hypothetical protein
LRRGERTWLLSGGTFILKRELIVRHSKSTCKTLI